VKSCVRITAPYSYPVCLCTSFAKPEMPGKVYSSKVIVRQEKSSTTMYHVAKGSQGLLLLTRANWCCLATARCSRDKQRIFASDPYDMSILGSRTVGSSSDRVILRQFQTTCNDVHRIVRCDRTSTLSQNLGVSIVS
jgi:hypothetical protein